MVYGRRSELKLKFAFSPQSFPNVNNTVIARYRCVVEWVVCLVPPPFASINNELIICREIFTKAYSIRSVVMIIMIMMMMTDIL